MALAGTPCEPLHMRHVPLHEPVRTVWYGIEQTYQASKHIKTVNLKDQDDLNDFI